MLKVRVACGSKLWENARNASAIERCGCLPLPPHLRGRGGGNFSLRRCSRQSGSADLCERSGMSF